MGDRETEERNENLKGAEWLGPDSGVQNSGGCRRKAWRGPHALGGIEAVYSQSVIATLSC